MNLTDIRTIKDIMTIHNIHFRKEFGTEKYGVDHLDLFNPNVYTFLDSLFTEYLEGDDPVFVGKQVHIGTDEYSNAEKETVEKFRAFTDHYIRHIESFGKQALIEEYAGGQEYSVEHISYKGKHYFLAMTLKHTTGAPNFIETGHMQPAPVDADTLERVKAVISHALDTLGVENSASHAEVKIDNDRTIRIIEIGARMGGDCIGSELVRYSTGYDFIKMVIQVACGEEPDFTQVCEPIAVESVFIFDNNDISELERIKQENPERILKIVDYHPENIGHITDSSNRAGCYIRKAL